MNLSSPPIARGTCPVFQDFREAEKNPCGTKLGDFDTN